MQSAAEPEMSSKDVDLKGVRWETGEPNLDLLKLSIVGDVTWTNETPQLTSQEASSTQAELYSDVETSRESVCKTKVTLLQGIATGLNKPLKVPTSNLPHSLGKYVEIQPGKSSHEREEKMTIRLGSAHIMDISNPALTSVLEKEMYFIGRFSCRVKLGGKVLYALENSTVEEFRIADIVDEVKDWPRASKQLVENDLKALEIVRREDGAPKHVTWAVVGTCEFQGHFEQTIEWK